MTPPRTFGRQNTATIIPQLLELLLKQLENGQINGLSIVTDADQSSEGAGVQARWNAIASELRKNGYAVPNSLSGQPAKGSTFSHCDGLPDIGLWLMPDHHNDGMLEDMLRSAIRSDLTQDKLVQYAGNTLENLPQQLFSDYQLSKALVYTWLAWQRRPGLGLSALLRNPPLLDFDKSPLVGLVSWLHKVFP